MINDVAYPGTIESPAPPISLGVREEALIINH